MKNLFDTLKENVVNHRQASAKRKISRSERRKAIAELRSLSDSELKDLGIARSSIAYSVKHGRPADRAA